MASQWDFAVLRKRRWLLSLSRGTRQKLRIESSSGEIPIRQTSLAQGAPDKNSRPLQPNGVCVKVV